MHAFQYYVPTEIVFGAGSVSKLPELLKKRKLSRVLVVYGGSSARKSGLLDRVFQLLEKAGVSYQTLGGGSVIDTCKAIAHGTANPETDLWEFWRKRAVLTRSMPVGVVLTIPAAGSETSDSAVLTNAESGEKRGLNTDLNRPVFAILDPVLAATLPNHQVACGVSDILMHTMDRYFNPVTDNDLTDELAEALLRYHRGVTFLSGNTITPLIFNAFARINLEFWSDYVRLEGIARSLHTLSRFTKLIEAGEGDAAAELLRQGLERFRAALCQ